MKPETEIKELRERVAKLEMQVSSLLLRTALVDPSSRDVTPAGYIEIGIGVDIVKLPYFQVSSS